MFIKKILLISIIILPIFFTNGFSSDFGEEKQLNKYQQAIRLCDPSNEDPNKYEQAIKICGADNFRCFPVTTWLIDFLNFFVDDYERLIKIELHHVVGDMMEIAQIKDHDIYQRYILSQLEYNFKKTWFEQRINEYTTISQMEKLIIPEKPEDMSFTIDDIHESFITMIGLFERWDELQTSDTTRLRNFYSEIRSHYDYGKLIIFRMTRKGEPVRYYHEGQYYNLSYSPHSTFSIYSHSAYKNKVDQKRKQELLSLSFESAALRSRAEALALRSTESYAAGDAEAIYEKRVRDGFATNYEKFCYENMRNTRLKRNREKNKK